MNWPLRPKRVPQPARPDRHRARRLRNTSAMLIPAALIAGLLGASPATADGSAPPADRRSVVPL